MPSADSCPLVSAPYGTLSSEFRTTDRPPGVNSAAFTTHLPNLPPRLLMVMAFAITCLLCQPGRPYIGFLFVRSWICSTLPSDPASQRRPCASLVLRHHQAGQGTFTPELLSMPGTHERARTRRAFQGFDGERLSYECFASSRRASSAKNPLRLWYSRCEFTYSSIRANKNCGIVMFNFVAFPSYLVKSIST